MDIRVFFTGHRLAIALAVGSLATAVAQTGLPDFSNLNLDDLASVKITSFANKEQKLSQVAGAVYVITREQIARSGLTSVPELLRLAPGVDVAQVNGNQWSVSIRGSVGAYANKLLVLVDGRSVYSSVFSGVYWELGMPILENIERIEVIRGPGATIWGANAVLGVINIITRTSQDTHGTLITAGGGSLERGFGSVTTGGAFGSTTYRGYFGGSDSAPLSQASGAHADDGMNSMQGGFRLDGSHNRDSWMLDANLFRAMENDTGINVSPSTLQFVESPSHFNSLAANVSGEWQRSLGDTGRLRIKSYYDYVDRPQPQASKVESGTWDTELQYDFTAGQVHTVSAGGGDRLISDKVAAAGNLTFVPAELTYVNVNAFAQDEMHFVHDSLLFTVGVKVEHNHFGGWGLEPSANLLWMPAKRHSLWISSARSLRTPSLFDIAVEGPFTSSPPSAATGGLPVLLSFAASPAFSTESVNDFEAGYRGQLTKTISADLSVFYDQFSNIRSAVISYPVFAPSPFPHLDATASTGNGTEATGKGAESSITWEVLPKWKLQASYTYNLIDPWISSSAPPGTTYGSLKLPSHNKWRLQSYINVSKSWEFDTFLYWTSAASPTNNLGPDIPVPSWLRLDVRLGYRAGRNWQLSLAGQNLLEARHLEAVAELLSVQSYVDRSVYLKSTWQF